MERYHQQLALVDERRPAERKRLFREICRGWYIGTAKGKQELAAKFNAPGPETTAAAQGEVVLANARHDADMATDALAEALAALGKSKSDIDSDRKGAPWKIEIAADLRSRFAVSNRWLGEHLNMGHPCAVSRLLSQKC